MADLQTMAKNLDRHPDTDIKIDYKGDLYVAEFNGEVVASDESYVGLIAQLNARKHARKHAQNSTT